MSNLEQVLKDKKITVEQLEALKELTEKLCSKYVKKYFRNQTPPQNLGNVEKWTDDLFPPSKESLLSKEYSTNKLEGDQVIQINDTKLNKNEQLLCKLNKNIYKYDMKIKQRSSKLTSKFTFHVRIIFINSLN
jgi:hypothetical protein